MDVGNCGALNKDETAELEILTNLKEELLNSVVDGNAAIGNGGGKESVNICGLALNDSLSYLICKSLELSAVADKVGLTVKLNKCGTLPSEYRPITPSAAILLDFLAAVCKTLLTKDVNCLIHIAVGLNECLLAIHHATLVFSLRA